jgi:hypothetical protein
VDVHGVILCFDARTVSSVVARMHGAVSRRKYRLAIETRAKRHFFASRIAPPVPAWLHFVTPDAGKS